VFPVTMEEMDPFSEPEPSQGALVRLEDGRCVVVIYGKETGTLKVLVPEGADPTEEISAFLAEVPISSRAITWRVDAPSVAPAKAPRSRRRHATVHVGAPAKKAARKVAQHAPRRKR
jgi:hypothetical protein